MGIRRMGNKHTKKIPTNPLLLTLLRQRNRRIQKQLQKLVRRTQTNRRRQIRPTRLRPHHARTKRHKHQQNHTNNNHQPTNQQHQIPTIHPKTPIHQQPMDKHQLLPPLLGQHKHQNNKE